MISNANVAALSRLTRGKNKLDLNAMGRLIDDIQSTEKSHLLGLVIPVKPTRARKPIKPKPDWLVEIQRAQKRIPWKAAEAKDKLYDLAISVGFETSEAPQKSFPKSAEHIAKQIGGERLRDVFVDWVETFAKENTLS